MKKQCVVPLVVLLALWGCSEAPTGPGGELPARAELVITEGIAAPPRVPGRPLFADLKDASLSVGGSFTSPLSVNGAGCSGDLAANVTVTYTVSGGLRTAASFQVYSNWVYDGANFNGSGPATVEIPVRSGTPTTYSVKLSVSDPTGTGSGPTSFLVKPFNVENNPDDPTGQQLKIDASSNATVYVEFTDCIAPNTPPTLTFPDDITVEATSSAGAAVKFMVTAVDAEDGDLTEDVVCRVNGTEVRSGDTFPLGKSTVECEVTDSGGLSASGSFKITVVDTMPAEFTSFPNNQTLIAANINGAVLDIESLGITAEDWNNVSEPATWACDYAAGTWLAIGSRTEVACTATDAIGNKSVPNYFEVFVTLDLSPLNGFDSPLRMSSPYSAHKAGSAIPHKFAAPRYADGSPAADLAEGLRLTLVRKNSSETYRQVEMDDYGAGSTAWRYSKPHYIFNLKTEKGWGGGDWTTTVSYAGITLASTTFSMRN